MSTETDPMQDRPRRARLNTRTDDAYWEEMYLREKALRFKAEARLIELGEDW